MSCWLDIPAALISQHFTCKEKGLFGLGCGVYCVPKNLLPFRVLIPRRPEIAPTAFRTNDPCLCGIGRIAIEPDSLMLPPALRALQVDPLHHQVSPGYKIRCEVALTASSTCCVVAWRKVRWSFPVKSNRKRSPTENCIRVSVIIHPGCVASIPSGRSTRVALKPSRLQTRSANVGLCIIPNASFTLLSYSTRLSETGYYVMRSFQHDNPNSQKKARSRMKAGLDLFSHAG